MEYALSAAYDKVISATLGEIKRYTWKKLTFFSEANIENTILFPTVPNINMKQEKVPRRNLERNSNQSFNGTPGGSMVQKQFDQVEFKWIWSDTFWQTVAVKFCCGNNRCVSFPSISLEQLNALWTACVKFILTCMYRI